LLISLSHSTRSSCTYRHRRATALVCDVSSQYRSRTNKTPHPSLPRTGAVVFTIRTYFHPITEICKEPYVPGRLASAIRSWGDDVSRYKGRERYGDVLLEYLDKMHEEQIKNGLDLSVEEEVCKYPY
jgi:hypothetical protein